MSNVSFADLGLAGPLLRALHAANYVQPTPIQARTIPLLLQGRDVLGIAQTGTGKTAAFVLPMLTMLEKGRARARMPRTLILEPTRELAAQVETAFHDFARFTNLSTLAVFGGVGYGHQRSELRRGVVDHRPARRVDQVRGRLHQGELALAEVVIYLAVAPKSNAAYVAYNAARALIREDKSRPVPEHLRNAPTKLMKDLGYGADYRYAHDEAGAYAAGESYFPDGMTPAKLYEPTEFGLEAKIREKLEHLRELDRKARK